MIIFGYIKERRADEIETEGRTEETKGDVV